MDENRKSQDEPVSDEDKERVSQEKRAELEQPNQTIENNGTKKSNKMRQK